MVVHVALHARAAYVCAAPERCCWLITCLSLVFLWTENAVFVKVATMENEDSVPRGSGFYSINDRNAHYYRQWL